jgi:hypothetical protein
MSHETDSYKYMTALILVMLVWFVGTDTIFFVWSSLCNFIVILSLEIQGHRYNDQSTSFCLSDIWVQSQVSSMVLGIICSNEMCLCTRCQVFQTMRSQYLNWSSNNLLARCHLSENFLLEVISYVGQERKFCTGIWDLCLLSTWAEDHLHASFGMITKFDKLPSVS